MMLRGQENSAFNPARICPPGPPSVIPAKAGIQRGGEGVVSLCVVSLCLVPSLGRGSLAHYARPKPRDFHPLMRPQQGHWRFLRRRESRGVGMGNVARSKTTRGEGLVPRWGVAAAKENLQCRFPVPNHYSSFSYLGVPAPAGTSTIGAKARLSAVRV